MLRLIERLATTAGYSATLTLNFEQRTRGRLRVRLDDGREAGLWLERGQILRDGDCLAADDGEVIRIVAAAETVSSVRCDDTLLLARACYHLGNRHVPLQIEPKRLCYRHDHVLDDMLRGMGMAVVVEQAPFDPEPGAYGASGHGHSHEH